LKLIDNYLNKSNWNSLCIYPLVVKKREYQNLKNIRKLAVTIIAGILLIFGILMIILPGPALIIIPLALVILNTYHPEKVRSYARKFQRGLSKAAAWLDKKIKEWG